MPPTVVARNSLAFYCWRCCWWQRCCRWACYCGYVSLLWLLFNVVVAAVATYVATQAPANCCMCVCMLVGTRVQKWPLLQTFVAVAISKCCKWGKWWRAGASAWSVCKDRSFAMSVLLSQLKRLSACECGFVAANACGNVLQEKIYFYCCMLATDFICALFAVI